MNFASYHPALNLLFFVAVIAFTACWTHPGLVAVSFLCALAYSARLRGPRAVAFGCALVAAALAFAHAAQRQLDRHRIAALAAGKVPAAVDAAPEPMTPAALAAAFASPEPLDPRWPELLRRVAALPACPPFRMTAVQQTCLAQTIVWRHGMDALDDRDVVFPVQYAAATLRLLACLAAVSDCTDAQLVVLVTREVENDPEALSRLRAGLQIEIKMNAQEARDDEKM